MKPRLLARALLKGLLSVGVVSAGMLSSTAILAVPASAAPRSVTDPQAPRELPADGPVSVRWNDPATFSELRNSPNRFEAQRGDWVRQIATHLRTSASAALQPGQTLEVTLTDIKRAGDFEPWQGPRATDIRFMRDIYPPRLTFQYVLKAADGRVLDEGEAQLRDTGYLHGSGGLASNSDPLRYEKKLIDDWRRRVLAKAAAGG